MYTHRDTQSHTHTYHTEAHKHVHTQRHTITHTHTYHTEANKHIHTQRHTNMYTHRDTHTHTYCTEAHIHVHTQRHTNMYTQRHTHTHTHTHVDGLAAGVVPVLEGGSAPCLCDNAVSPRGSLWHTRGVREAR